MSAPTSRHPYVKTPLGQRVLVGVDGSAESLDAVRQAEALVDADGVLTLLSVWQSVDGRSVIESADAAEREIGGARRVLRMKPARLEVAWGEPGSVLMREAQRDQATMLAVGTRGRGRLAGILLGSTPTELAHRSPCPLLIARPTTGWFPRRVVVGIDGSPESAAAYAVADAIAMRRGAALEKVVAVGGAQVDTGMAEAIAGSGCRIDPVDAVRALVRASKRADLVVVGSRGLSGLKALGSVSERVAHDAHCSVLIVRLPH